MATVLFAWELGAGLGHMLQLLPLAQGMADAGHRVFVALRDLTRAVPIFAPTGAALLQAPWKPPGTTFFPRVGNFAHLLSNVGWGDDRHLAGLTAAWRSLYRLVRPDLIVFDHSPTALLAARGVPARRALVNVGFFCPPDVSPLPLLRPVPPEQRPRLAEHEAHLLARVNRLLAHWKQPPLERVAQLFAQVDENFLTTFPEFDHYGAREGARYWGPVNGTGGLVPRWPEGDGGRVYAYLKPSPSLPTLLALLNERGQPTLISADGIDPALRRQFTSPTLRFEDQRLDLAQIAGDCSFAILNGNHGTLTTLLLAGVPMLQLPLTLEQRINAENVRRTGAGEVITRRDADAGDVRDKLSRLSSDPRYRAAAERFRDRHAGFDPVAQRREMLDRLAQLL